MPEALELLETLVLTVILEQLVRQEVLETWVLTEQAVLEEEAQITVILIGLTEVGDLQELLGMLVEQV
jgi:hypothetical protein